MITGLAALSTGAICLALALGPALAQTPLAKTNQIAIAYVTPKDAAHRPLQQLLQQRRALETLQELLSPIRLPQQLLLKVEGCDGVSNGWYDDGVVTVCYEYLEEIRQTAPPETTATGVTPLDTLLGPFFDVFLHEVGHALFHLLAIPVLGREEDAADQFSAYLLLNFGREESHRLIGGVAYSYYKEAQSDGPLVELKAFSDEHGTPAQRFYNVLCIAYGADPELFESIVAKGYLPSERAELCADEYRQVAYAFQTLIAPHIDPDLAAKVHAKKWLPDVVPARTPRPPRTGQARAPS
jgi:Putative metallopeptidase